MQSPLAAFLDFRMSFQATGAEIPSDDDTIICDDCDESRDVLPAIGSLQTLGNPYAIDNLTL